MKSRTRREVTGKVVLALGGLLTLCPGSPALEPLSHSELAGTRGGLILDGQSCVAEQNGCAGWTTGECRVVRQVLIGGQLHDVYQYYWQRLTYFECALEEGGACDAANTPDTDQGDWTPCGTVFQSVACPDPTGLRVVLKVPGCHPMQP